MRNIILFLVLCAAPLVGFGQSKYFEGMSFDQSTGRTTIPGWSGDAPVCGQSFDFGAYNNGQQAQSIESDSADSISQYCGYLADRGRRNKVSEWWDRANDTLRLYIEKCANEPNAWTKLGDISNIIHSNLNLHPQQKWVELREWFKKVLYYNTEDSFYFCADIEAILSTFYYFEGRGHDALGASAVAKYIKESGRCSSWDFVKDSDTAYTLAVFDAITAWRDTVTDSLATPLDTTLPSLEELDLTILRGPQSSVTPATHEPRLGELIATRNPFADVLELKYRLAKSGMVRIDVFDLLGRSVYSEGQGYKQDGEHTLSLQSKSWSSGSYYVRLSTPSGEVKTVKVVKE